MGIFVVLAQPGPTPAPAPAPIAPASSGQSTIGTIGAALLAGPPVESPLATAIRREFPNDHLVLASGQWLIAFDGTAQDLYAKLTGSVTTNVLGTMFVASIFGYWGYAPSN